MFSLKIDLSCKPVYKSLCYWLSPFSNNILNKVFRGFELVYLPKKIGWYFPFLCMEKTFELKIHVNVDKNLSNFHVIDLYIFRKCLALKPTKDLKLKFPTNFARIPVYKYKVRTRKHDSKWKIMSTCSNIQKPVANISECDYHTL